MLNKSSFLIGVALLVAVALAVYVLMIRPTQQPGETVDTYCSRVFAETKKCPSRSCEVGCGGDPDPLGGCVIGCNPKTTITQ